MSEQKGDAMKCRYCGLEHSEGVRCWDAMRHELAAMRERAEEDTNRLNFLMRFFRVEDVGDDSYCAGMVVDIDAVSDAFDRGPLGDEVVTLTGGWVNPDMRRAIDKAMAFAEAAGAGKQEER